MQTPWVLRGHNPNDPNNECIVKEDCYVFDFAPDRALKQLADYCVRLNTDDKKLEQKVAEFIQFCLCLLMMAVQCVLLMPPVFWIWR